MNVLFLVLVVIGVLFVLWFIIGAITAARVGSGKRRWSNALVSLSEMDMKIKISRFLGVFFLLFIVFTFSLASIFAAKPSERIVVGAKLKEYKPPTRPHCDISVPKQYATIQGAIDSAGNGDTICVGRGIYNEDVSINKSVQLSGRGVRKTIINGQDPNAQGTVSITANNVTLEGFLINGVSTNLTQVAVAINGSDSGPVSEVIVRYNRVVAGSGGIALRTIRVQNSTIQNNILEGNNSPYVAAEGGLDGVGSLNINFTNNTFIGTVNPNDRADTGITLDAGVPDSLIQRNAFNTTGTMITLIAPNGTSIINENNFNSNTTIKVSNGWPTTVNAENNWWGDLDPSDNVQGSVDYTPFTTSPFVEN